jgi:3-hydroxybutyryl-CoA dehydrogenase
MSAQTRVAVVGCGTMGAGIAQCCAQAGLATTVVEMDGERLQAGRQRLDAFIGEGVRRGKVSEADRDATLARIRGTTALTDCAGAEIVIEAIVEELSAKRALLGRLGDLLDDDAIVATNTSALSVTELARSYARPERVGGLHFFNPAPLMELVEVVVGLDTAPETEARLTAFAHEIGKTPVTTKDRPGFLVNRLLMPYLNQALQAYDDGIASAEDIDAAVELGLGYRLGPLKLLDLIGLDTHEHATRAAYEQTLDPDFAPPPLLSRMVAAGRLGRKAGRGLRVGEEG